MIRARSWGRIHQVGSMALRNTKHPAPVRLVVRTGPRPPPPVNVVRCSPAAASHRAAEQATSSVAPRAGHTGDYSLFGGVTKRWYRDPPEERVEFCFMNSRLATETQARQIAMPSSTPWGLSQAKVLLGHAGWEVDHGNTGRIGCHPRGTGVA